MGLGALRRGRFATSGVAYPFPSSASEPDRLAAKVR